LIESSESDSGENEYIDLSELGEGTYYIEVESYDGLYGGYDLEIKSWGGQEDMHPEILIESDWGGAITDFMMSEVSEEIFYYVHDINGLEELYDGEEYVFTEHPVEATEFIDDVFSYIDTLIDLDFVKSDTYNGTSIDIYAANEEWEEGTLGLAAMRDEGYIDVLWLQTETPGLSDNDKNTIVHEIGHALGLSHPYGDGNHRSFDTSDTVMSYNEGDDGWNFTLTDLDILALQSLWGEEDDIYPPIQRLDLSTPNINPIRENITTSTSITYTTDDQNLSLTGISPSLFFDSSQINIELVNEPYQGSLLGWNITTDENDDDNDTNTDSIIAFSYTDFLGNFPGPNVSLPLTLADLSITPTADYAGTTLNLTGIGAIGYEVVGETLTLDYDAAPVVANPIEDLSTDALTDWIYSIPSDLFYDPDSELTLSLESQLPAWVNFDSESFTFSGRPESSADSFSVEVSASDALGSIETPLTLTVQDVQTITSDTQPINYQGGDMLSFPLIYRVTDNQPSTGINFQLHYDSSLFTFDSITDPITEILGYSVSDDSVTDLDGDPSTDSVLNVSIVSFLGALESGVELGTFNFDVADLPPADPNETDPITGLRPSAMNLTASETAFGYNFSADPITLEPVLFNLDVDCDGQVTALGDGLMVIRKLFGAAFADDALTNKAISPNADRTTNEIHEFLESGIDSGFLDVDNDGKTTALGDGLMIIRRLFGNAFAGESLISKAISPESPYMGHDNAWEMVAANIDDMMI